MTFTAVFRCDYIYKHALRKVTVPCMQNVNIGRKLTGVSEAKVLKQDFLKI